MEWDNRRSTNETRPRRCPPGTSRMFSLTSKPSSSPPPVPVSIPNRSSSYRRRALEVLIHLAFDAPVQDEYRRTYTGSETLDASDEICESLLRRVDYGAKELITRRDSSALDGQSEYGYPTRARRFRIAFSIYRGGILWAETQYDSFQKKALAGETARDIILATDRMVGAFLFRNDVEFRWTGGPIKEYFTPRPTTYLPPCIGHPQFLTCVPRSRFIESNQSFEFVAGYEIELDLQARWPGCGMPQRLSKTVVARSTQNSPLNLQMGEALLWRIARAAYQIIDQKQVEFEDMHHQSCDGLEGPGGCQHFHDDAVDLTLRIRNNLGPDYDHLFRRISTKQVLFRDADAGDFLDVVGKLNEFMLELRDNTDAAIGRLDDFVLRITELKTAQWSMASPLAFSLDSSASYSHPSIDAILDRVQTGICDVLRGNDIDISVVAHKRGHLILDKTIKAHARDGRHTDSWYKAPHVSKDYVLKRLRERIEEDITIICQDTGSLAAKLPDSLPNLRVTNNSGIRLDSQRTAPMPTEAMGAVEAVGFGNVTVESPKPRGAGALAEKVDIVRPPLSSPRPLSLALRHHPSLPSILEAEEAPCQASVVGVAQQDRDCDGNIQVKTNGTNQAETADVAAPEAHIEASSALPIQPLRPDGASHQAENAASEAEPIIHVPVDPVPLSHEYPHNTQELVNAPIACLGKFGDELSDRTAHEFFPEISSTPSTPSLMSCESDSLHEIVITSPMTIPDGALPEYEEFDGLKGKHSIDDGFANQETIIVTAARDADAAEHIVNAESAADASPSLTVVLWDGDALNLGLGAKFLENAIAAYEQAAILPKPMLVHSIPRVLDLEAQDPNTALGRHGEARKHAEPGKHVEPSKHAEPSKHEPSKHTEPSRDESTLAMVPASSMALIPLTKHASSLALIAAAASQRTHSLHKRKSLGCLLMGCVLCQPSTGVGLSARRMMGVGLALGGRPVSLGIRKL